MRVLGLLYLPTQRPLKQPLGRQNTLAGNLKHRAIMHPRVLAYGRDPNHSMKFSPSTASPPGWKGVP